MIVLQQQVCKLLKGFQMFVFKNSSANQKDWISANEKSISIWKPSAEERPHIRLTWNVVLNHPPRNKQNSFLRRKFFFSEFSFLGLVTKYVSENMSSPYVNNIKSILSIVAHFKKRVSSIFSIFQCFQIQYILTLINSAKYITIFTIAYSIVIMVFFEQINDSFNLPPDIQTPKFRVLNFQVESFDAGFRIP